VKKSLPLWRRIVGVVLLAAGVFYWRSIGRIFWSVKEDPDQLFAIGFGVIVGSGFVMGGVALLGLKMWRHLVGYCCFALAALELYGLRSLYRISMRLPEGYSIDGLGLRIWGLVTFLLIFAIMGGLLLRWVNVRNGINALKGLRGYLETNWRRAREEGCVKQNLPLWRRIVGGILLFSGTVLCANIGYIFWAVAETLKGDPDDWMIVAVPVFFGCVLVTGGVVLLGKQMWRRLLGYCCITLAVIEALGILTLLRKSAMLPEGYRIDGLGLRIWGLVVCAFVSAVMGVFLLPLTNKRKWINV